MSNWSNWNFSQCLGDSAPTALDISGINSFIRKTNKNLGSEVAVYL